MSCLVDIVVCSHIYGYGGVEEEQYCHTSVISNISKHTWHLEAALRSVNPGSHGNSFDHMHLTQDGCPTCSMITGF